MTLQMCSPERGELSVPDLRFRSSKGCFVTCPEGRYV